MHRPERNLDPVFRSQSGKHSIAVIVKADNFSGTGHGQPVNQVPGMFFLDAHRTHMAEQHPAIVGLSPHSGQIIQPALHEVWMGLGKYTGGHHPLSLRESFQLALYIHLQTFQPDNDTLYVYSYQEFNVKLGMRAELLVPLE